MYYSPMPTKFRRLMLTLDPPLDAALARVSALMGKPQATICRELMSEAIPALDAMAKALEQARTQPKHAVAGMVDMLERKVAEASGVATEARQLSMRLVDPPKRGRKPKGGTR